MDPEQAVTPTTTSEEDLQTASQRHINRIWEYTQAALAIMVSIATLLVASTLSISSREESASFLLLSNAFFLIIGFYFGRTNHSRPSGGLRP